MPPFIKNILLLLVFQVTLSVAAQEYPERLLFKDFAKQYEGVKAISDTLLKGGRTVAFRELDRNAEWAVQKGDMALKYGFLLMKWQAIVSEERKDDDIEKMLQKIISRLSKERIVLYNAFAQQLLARYYWIQKQYSSAFEYYINAHHLYNDYGVDEFPMKGDFLSEFGGRFYHFKDYNTAKKYFIEANDCSGSSSVSLMNTIGLSFLYLKQYDSAQFFYKKALDTALKHGYIDWVGIISGNLGYLYYVKGNKDAAVSHFRKEIELYEMQNQGAASNAARSYALLSEIILPEDKTLAMQYALRAVELSRKYNDISNPLMQKSIYPVLAHAYAANGNTALAYIYADSAGIAKDSIAANTNALVLAGAQHSTQAEKRLLRLKQVEKEQQMNLVIRNSLIAGLVLVILVTILLVNRHRIKTANMQQLLEAHRFQAETELQNAAIQLKAFTQSISEKNELIEQFSSEIQRMQQHTTVPYDNKQLETLQRSTILTDKEWNEFQLMFEKAHAGYIQRLKQKVQGLSPVDTRFILLSKLRLSTNEMSLVLGISPDGVRANKERIKNKLKLRSENSSLESFADLI
jgi:tetratricopeptide (TPR) repeat protein